MAPMLLDEDDEIIVLDSFSLNLNTLCRNRPKRRRRDWVRHSFICKIATIMVSSCIVTGDDGGGGGLLNSRRVSG
jgi:hypothetical protein